MSLRYRISSAAQHPLRRLQIALFVRFLLIAGSTLFYRRVEGMGWIDALYMTGVSVATVGFGETESLSQGGRLFTTALIMAGVGVGASAAGDAIEVMLGQRYWLSVERRKMTQRTEELRDHFVCGYGSWAPA